MSLLVIEFVGLVITRIIPLVTAGGLPAAFSSTFYER